MIPRHFLDLQDCDAAALKGIVASARAMKKARADLPKGMAEPTRPLAGRALALIFERPSTRTRVSFEMAMRQLGGEVIVLSAGDMQLGRGETVADTARVLSRYVDAIMLRAAKHENLIELAQYASVPVINGLTNKSHPCQVMADVMTLEEKKGPLANQKVAWLGDGNNVASSWIHASAILGGTLVLATPEELSPDAATLTWGQKRNSAITLLRSPEEAVADADCVITDSWVSMHDTDGERRHNLLKPYQVNRHMMAKAKKNALFMHCLPAHRNEEVTDEVMDGPQSAVWDEAENRLHIQKAILLHCLGQT